MKNKGLSALVSTAHGRLPGADRRMLQSQRFALRPNKIGVTMTRKAKKLMQFTAHTLWTAPSAPSLVTCDVPITNEIREQFRKSLVASEQALKSKLETFRTIDTPEAATRSLVK